MATVNASTFSQPLKDLKIEKSILVQPRIKTYKAVKYDRTELGATVLEDGSEITRWEVERIYADPQEAKKVVQVYNNARYRIRAACINTDVGFVCSWSRRKELQVAIDEAHELINEANARFKHCYLKFRVVCTKLTNADDDHVELLRDAIVDQTEKIAEALRNFDPKKARQLISASKHLTGVVSDDKTRQQLEKARKEASALAAEMQRATKECGNVLNAIESKTGGDLLNRANAPWNIL